MEQFLKDRFLARGRVYLDMMATTSPITFLALAEKYQRLSTEIFTITKYQGALDEIPSKITALKAENQMMMERMQRWNCLTSVRVLETNLRIINVLQEMLDTASDVSGLEPSPVSEVSDSSPSTNAQAGS